MQTGDWKLCVKKDSTKLVEQLLKNQNLTLFLKLCLQHLYFGGILGTLNIEFFTADFEAFRLKFSPRCYVWQERGICPEKSINMTWQIST